MLYRQNVAAAAIKAERAIQSGKGFDPVSGYTLKDIREWLETVAQGTDPQDLSPVSREVEATARAALNRIFQ